MSFPMYCSVDGILERFGVMVVCDGRGDLGDDGCEVNIYSVF